MVGATIVSWIIQCDEAVCGTSRPVWLVYMAIDDWGLRRSIVGAGFKEWLKDCVGVVEVIVDDIHKAGCLHKI